MRDTRCGGTYRGKYQITLEKRTAIIYQRIIVFLYHNGVKSAAFGQFQPADIEIVQWSEIDRYSKPDGNKRDKKAYTGGNVRPVKAFGGFVRYVSASAQIRILLSQKYNKTT